MSPLSTLRTCFSGLLGTSCFHLFASMACCLLCKSCLAPVRLWVCAQASRVRVVLPLFAYITFVRSAGYELSCLCSHKGVVSRLTGYELSCACSPWWHVAQACWGWVVYLAFAFTAWCPIRCRPLSTWYKMAHIEILHEAEKCGLREKIYLSTILFVSMNYWQWPGYMFSPN